MREFGESTTLTTLQPKSSSFPLISLVVVFESLLVLGSIFFLPVLSDDCSEAPLYIWTLGMVGVSAVHLAVNGLHNLLKTAESWNKCHEVTFGVVHLVLVLGIIGWGALGHYWGFGSGLECSGSGVFFTSVSVMVGTDLVALGLLVSWLISVFK